MCTEVENYLSLPARALYYFSPLCQGGDLLNTDLKKALSIETDCTSLENSSCVTHIIDVIKDKEKLIIV